MIDCADLWDGDGDDQDLLVTRLPDQGLVLFGDGAGGFETTPGDVVVLVEDTDTHTSELAVIT